MNLRDLVFFGIQSEADTNPFKTHKPTFREAIPSTVENHGLAVDHNMFGSDSQEDVSDQFLRSDGPKTVSRPEQAFSYHG